eukprot:jgi/Ulvmu1/11076/UM007_0258.1
MRSYAETISSSGSGPLVASTAREAAPASGSGSAGAGVAKLLAVLFAVAAIGGATFAAIYFGVDDTHIKPKDSADGAFVNGFDPTESVAAAPIVPPKPPKDPISEDPVVPEDPVDTSTSPATPRSTTPSETTPSAQPGATPTATPTTPAAAPTAAAAPAAPAAAVPGPPPLLPALVRNVLAHTVDQQIMDYRYGDMLGDTFMFYEAQHSGNITAIPGGSRHGWRGVQMLEDGEDVGMDLAGGMYEAGNRLKITLTTSYLISHLGWICSYYEETFAAIEYDGETVLHWCKREVRWALDYLLRTHRFEGPERPSDWTDATDSLVLMVGGVPDDWDCYDRAEVIPSKKPGFCRSKAMRRTLVADAEFPAAEVAGYASAAFAAGAALLQKDDPEYAVEAMKSAYAVWKFGERHNKSAATWSTEVVRTYGVKTTAPFMLYGAAMIAWVHRCDDPALPLCRETKARPWLAIAEEMWQYNVANVPQRHAEEMLVSWSNPDYDTALLLTQVTGNVTSPYARHVSEFIRVYVDADGSQVWATPKGLRKHPKEKWASLRTSYTAAFIASMYATFPGVPEANVTEALCFARSQLGYIAGDNPLGMSYVVGFGTKWPLQVHHRDTACTLLEAVNNECYDHTIDLKLFFADRPNPVTLIGSVVGGPDTRERFRDERNEYHYTEVALDYNAALTAALAGVASMPPAIWATDCSTVIPKYDFAPYPAKDSPARISAYASGDNPNAGMDVSPELLKLAAAARA